MDKCILSNNDVEELFKWQNRNKDLVRRGACPIKAIEIVLPDAQTYIKYVRQDDIVKAHFVCQSQPPLIYNYKVEITPNKFWKVLKVKPDKGEWATMKYIQDIMGLYFALMALMVYGDDRQYTQEELNAIDEAVNFTDKTELEPDYKANNKQKPKSKPKSKQGTIYLFNKDSSGKVRIGCKGKRNSPKGEFRVRGHFRHLKSGKVIWIAEYKKGNGNKKNKTYKL